MFCCENYCWKVRRILGAVLQIFDRVKSVALWSAKKKKINKKTIKGYGSAASFNTDASNTIDNSSCCSSSINVAVNSLWNNPQFHEHQFLEQSNYFDGHLIINQYRLLFQTRTLISSASVKYLIIIRPDYYIQITEKKYLSCITVYTTIKSYLAPAWFSIN